MKFSHPEAFYLLIVLALFAITAVYNFKKRRQLLRGFISLSAFKRLGVRSGLEIDFFKTALITAALFFFIVALAGPHWGERFENAEIKGIEMVFLMDTSISMNAEDLKPNRLEVSKQLIATVTDTLQTDLVSLINFAAKAYVQCPLTTDYDAFKLLTEASSISPSEEQGTDFGEAFKMALNSFKTAANENKLAFLITDGEDQEKQWEDSLEQFKKKGVIVFTVGVGIPQGALIPIKDSNGNLTGWKKDKSGNIVKTRLDENTLIKIASQTGGQYFRLTNNASLSTITENLQAFERKTLKKRVQLIKIQRFHYFLIVGLLFLLIELILSERKLPWKKKTREN